MRSAYPPGVPSLLVTNDFPPKVGGIQSYLWELWRRLPPDEVTVLTTPYDGSAEFDRAQPFRVVRDKDRVLLPRPALADRIDALARDVNATLLKIKVDGADRDKLERTLMPRLGRAHRRPRG